MISELKLYQCMYFISLGYITIQATGDGTVHQPYSYKGFLLGYIIIQYVMLKSCHGMRFRCSFNALWSLLVLASCFTLLCSCFVGSGSHVCCAGRRSAGWKSPQHDLTGASLGLSAGVPCTQPCSWTGCLNRSVFWTRASTRADGGSEESELKSCSEQNDKNST